MKTLCKFIIISVLLCSLSGCTRGVSQPAGEPAASPIASPSAAPSESDTPKPELQYTFDPYALPSDAIAYLGDDMPDYRHLVDAVLDRQETVSLPEESMSKAVSCLLSEFPLSALVNDFNIDWESFAVTFSYIYGEEEHIAHIKAFKKRVEQAICSSVLPSYNDCELALSLYRWTVLNISYVDENDVSVYHALMDGEGICQSYDRAYRFLLLQVGMDALGAGSFMTDDAAHAWTMVPLDGYWFHMDPTFEDSANNGNGLQFFGMNDARREQSGALAPFNTGISDWFASAPSCESTCFDSFASCISWTLDANAHRVLLYDGIKNEPYAVFDTTSYEVRYSS